MSIYVQKIPVESFYLSCKFNLTTRENLLNKCNLNFFYSPNQIENTACADRFNNSYYLSVIGLGMF